MDGKGWSFMNGMSRRAFLRSAAGGAAGAAAAAALPGAVAVASSAQFDEHDRTPREPVVAYIDTSRGPEVRVMVGEREILHRDPDLVRRLLRAAR